MATPTRGSSILHLQDNNDSLYDVKTVLYIDILLIPLLILLIYTCYFIPSIPTNSSSSSSSLSQNSPSSQPQPQAGLDVAIINSLPITIYHQLPQMGSNASSECSICLGVFEEGEKVKVLQSCFHCYHCECVDKWLITHSSCPICRAFVRVDSPV